MKALRVDAMVFNLSSNRELVRLIDPQIQTSTQIPWGAIEGLEIGLFMIMTVLICR